MSVKGWLAFWVGIGVALATITILVWDVHRMETVGAPGTISYWIMAHSQFLWWLPVVVTLPLLLIGALLGHFWLQTWRLGQSWKPLLIGLGASVAWVGLGVVIGGFVFGQKP